MSDPLRKLLNCGITASNKALWDQSWQSQIYMKDVQYTCTFHALEEGSFLTHFLGTSCVKNRLQ